MVSRTTKTAKSTTSKPRTTRKTTAKAGTTKTSRGRTAKKTTPKVDLSKLRSQFIEIGGSFGDDGTISLDDRYVKIEPSEIDKWIETNLVNLEAIYATGDEREWITEVFPNSLIKVSVPDQETEKKEPELETEPTNEEIESQVKELLNKDLALLYQSQVERSPELQQAVNNSKQEMTKEELCQQFGFDPQESDGILCLKLAELGITVNVARNTSGKALYSIS